MKQRRFISALPFVQSLLSTILVCSQELQQTVTERDETKFLVSEHVKTEGTLLGEAEQVGLPSCAASLLLSVLFPVCPQLRDTVDDMLGDVEGLHSKLDRKRKVEEANQSTSQQLQVVRGLVGCGGALMLLLVLLLPST